MCRCTVAQPPTSSLPASVSWLHIATHIENGKFCMNRLAFAIFSSLLFDHRPNICDNSPWEFWQQWWRCVASRWPRTRRRTGRHPASASSQCQSCNKRNNWRKFLDTSVRVLNVKPGSSFLIEKKLKRDNWKNNIFLNPHTMTIRMFCFAPSCI